MPLPACKGKNPIIFQPTPHRAPRPAPRLSAISPSPTVVTDRWPPTGHRCPPALDPAPPSRSLAPLTSAPSWPPPGRPRQIPRRPDIPPAPRAHQIRPPSPLRCQPRRPDPSLRLTLADPSPTPSSSPILPSLPLPQPVGSLPTGSPSTAGKVCVLIGIFP